jgi:hypothetical protein
MIERIKWWSKRIGAFVQGVVMSVLLFFTYIFGLGATKLAALLFARRYLKLYEVGPARDSYWIDVKENEDAESLRRQY